MILHIEGGINRTYCQNLCLIFFPGAKFPEHENPSPETPEADVSLRVSDGVAEASVCLRVGDRREEAKGSAVLAAAVSPERAAKIAVGDAFVAAGSRLLGQMPPWGILTGVRPAKIAEELRRLGHTHTETVEALRRDYHVAASKAELLYEVNERQQYARSLIGEGTCSLYVSIPFCPTRCAYCSFVSYATPRYLATLPTYLDKLCEDIEATCRGIRERGERLTTVYIGGGTPTVLSAPQLDRLLGVINRSLPNRPREFTVEAGRPDTVTEEKFRVLLAHGVDRTSINPQILDDEVLQSIGRRHTVAEFYEAYRIAQKCGIRSINTDLIAGLPGASLESFCRTVDDIAALSPQNVTVHTYCVKRSADFTAEAAEQGDKRGIYSFSGGITGHCVDYAQTVLKEKGYFPYYLYRQKNAQGNLENVGFCREGYEGLYNIFIMEEIQSIYAVGAGAVTKIVGREGEKIRRIFEPKYTYEYISRP